MFGEILFQKVIKAYFDIFASVREYLHFKCIFRVEFLTLSYNIIGFNMKIYLALLKNDNV